MDTTTNGINELPIEYWDVNDKRLPLTKDIDRPFDPGELESLRNNGYQINAILVIKKGKEYFLVDGRNRVLKIRHLLENNLHTGKIKVQVITGIDPADRYAISMIANAQRSTNKLNDFRCIKAMRDIDPLMTWNDLYKKTGIPVNTLKAIDKTYSKVPLWAINAMVQGHITTSVAESLAHLNYDTQKELEELYSKKKKLTATDVKEKRRFVQQSVYAGMAPKLNIPTGRNFFMRSEMEELFNLIPVSAKDAKAFAQNLLS